MCCVALSKLLDISEPLSSPLWPPLALLLSSSRLWVLQTPSVALVLLLYILPRQAHLLPRLSPPPW